MKEATGEESRAAARKIAFRSRRLLVLGTGSDDDLEALVRHALFTTGALRSVRSIQR